MKTRQLILMFVVAACCMAWISAYGSDETKVKGLVTERTSDRMTVQASDGTTTAVVLTDETKVQVPKGLGLRKKEVSWTELIPGLRVEVKGTTNPQGQLEAKQVQFSKKDLETANMIQAGLAPTEQRVGENEQNVAANKQAIATNQQETSAKIEANEQAVDTRFKNLTDYDVKKDLVVKFSVGSSTLSQADKASLSELSSSAKDLQGYLIQVKGFADSSGNPANNQTLSRDRAESVIEYLMQDANVSPRHILAPGAMGVADPVASNETPGGRTENRRVEVKVLLNKGLQPSSMASPQ